MSLVDIAKFLAPGSLALLAMGCAFGLFVIHVWPKRRDVGRLWLFTLYSLYIVLGIPAVANWIAGPLPMVAGTAPSSPAGGTLVLLGGDNSVGRVQEAVSLFRTTRPSAVVVSGEDWLIDRLREAGIPRGSIRHDNGSATTREQLEYVATILPRASDPVTLIASRLQMPRVAALVRARNLNVRLAPSPVDIEPPTAGWLTFVPTYAALRVSRDAFYERMALSYYVSNGWIEAGY